MNRYIKFISFLLAFCLIIGLCACKDKEDKPKEQINSSAVESEALPENDGEIDPQNTELGRGDGSQVAAESLNSKKGMANGVDVSKWQGKIDWKRVKAAGIDFAVIRIGFRGENGNIYPDANAHFNIQQAEKAGLLIGVYFFSTAINTAEAEAEAVWTADQIKSYSISYPVVFDCEGYMNADSRMYGISAEERTANALAFLNKINSFGYEGMLYGAKGELSNPYYWDISKIEGSYKVWVAQYSDIPYPQKENPDYSAKYHMWQYTNKGRVDGITGNCDMVVSYFTTEKASPKEASKKPPEAVIPKTEEELLYTDIADRVTPKDTLNLRAGASTNFDIVATVKNGEFIDRIGIGKNGWSKLSYNGQTVYAVTSYLTDKVIEKPAEDIVNGYTFTPVSDKMTAKDEVNLREAPTTDSRIVATLTAGTFLDRTAITDRGWSRLTYNGQAVYAVTSFLTETYTEKPPETVTSVTEHGVTFDFTDKNLTAKSETNLRDRPTTDGSSVVYTLKNGEYVKCTGISVGGWARLEYSGQTVYAIYSYLTE